MNENDESRLDSNLNSRRAITEQECRAWIQDKVFVLRGSDYGGRYPKWPGMVGLEIEMGALLDSTASSSKPRIVPLRGAGSVTESFVLAQQKLFPHWQLNWSEGAEGKYLVSVGLPDGGALTFEPGGQIEYSSKPYPCLADALANMRLVQMEIKQALTGISARLIQYGINPWLTPDEIGLQMTKPRYLAMNDYFSHLSGNGPRMMRQTCTIQVNLDFGPDDTTLAKRYLLANLLAPVATAIFGHSPFVDGKISDRNSYRAGVWQGLDATRTGFPKGLESIVKTPTKDQCAKIYADSVLDACVVFVTGLNYQSQLRPITFRQWINQGIDGFYPDQNDFETHLTLHFPEVRARGFMELRSIDCQSQVWQELPATFYCSLLYRENNTEAALEMLLPFLQDLPKLWQSSVFGLKDPTLNALANKLMDLVGSGLSGLSPCFKGQTCDVRLQKFHQHFVARGRNPADDLRDYAQSLGRVPTPEEISLMDERWMALL